MNGICIGRDPMSDKPSTHLSKSLFIQGLQCHKALYLQKYRPELKDEIATATQMAFDAGHAVGDLARQLFPGGVIVPYDGLSYGEQIDMTQRLIEQGVETIYEASFSWGGVFVKADILHHGLDGWEIYEVKSSASEKPHYRDDVALQYHVISMAGLPVANAFLVHVNNRYVRQGDIDVKELFTAIDVTDSVKGKRPFIEDEIARQQMMLTGDEPAIDIGLHCGKPFACGFKGYCWSHIPSPSVFDYRGAGKPNSFELYKQGIIRVEDVPPEILGRRKLIQHEGMLYRKNHIDVPALNDYLASLWYPLCFIDFETTYMVPIPMYDGTRPYQQVPFQFSLHVIRGPDGELEHHEFLADGAKNPQQEFIERLLAAIPLDACILTWNQGFEIPRLKETRFAFPGKSSEINAIIDNVRDLMKPFGNMTIYDWRFKGSHSIKNVLPILVPELSYDDLEINEGGMASSAWLRMINSHDEEERMCIRKNLLQYCHLDTLAMVRILEEMRRMASP